MDNQRRSSGGTPKSSAQLGNLTGPARVLNDTVVSFHNCIQKWNEAYLVGVRLVQNIQTSNENEDQFQSSCERLGGVVDALRLQSNQMQSYCVQLNNLKTLNDAKMKIGVSWNLSNFGNKESPYF